MKNCCLLGDGTPPTFAVFKVSKNPKAREVINGSSKHFNVRSYEVAVKSQQFSVIESCKSSNTSAMCLNIDPCKGFNLVEFQDKCCSQIDLCPCDKSTMCPSRKCSANKISCGVNSKPCVKKKCRCPKPVPSKEPFVCRSCLEMGKEKNLRFCDKNSSICSKKNHRKTVNESLKDASIFYTRSCNCAKRRNEGKCVDEAFAKVEENKNKCRYVDLIHRIKCIFTKKE